MPFGKNLKHSSTTAQSDNPAYDVSANEWNADHSFPEGTSFPVGPSTGDVYYRTDLHLLCYYDGTRWLTVQQYVSTLRRVGDAPEPATATKTSHAYPLMEAVWIEEFSLFFFVSTGGTALGASHKWVVTLVIQNVGSPTSSSAIATQNVDSGASNAWRANSNVTGINTATAASDFGLLVTLTKTGTPGNLYAWTKVTYRKIVT